MITNRTIAFGTLLVVAIILLATIMPLLTGAQAPLPNSVKGTNITNTTTKDQNNNFIKDNQSLAELQQQIDAQKKEYAWAEPIERDLLLGKIKEPTGATKSPDNPVGYEPKVPIRGHTKFPWEMNSTQASIFASATSDVMTASYMYAGGNGARVPYHAGSVSGRTSSLANLISGGPEYIVLHSWATKPDGSGGYENAVCFQRSGSDIVVTFDVDGCKLPAGYSWQKTYFNSKDHVFSAGLTPNYIQGGPTFNQITLWVWDLTTNTYDSQTYNLPVTESVYNVDYALEEWLTQNGYPVVPNGLSEIVYNFQAASRGTQMNVRDGFFFWSYQYLNEKYTADWSSDGMVGTYNQWKLSK